MQVKHEMLAPDRQTDRQTDGTGAEQAVDKHVITAKWKEHQNNAQVCHCYQKTEYIVNRRDNETHWTALAITTTAWMYRLKLYTAKLTREKY